MFEAGNDIEMKTYQMYPTTEPQVDWHPLPLVAHFWSCTSVNLNDIYAIL